MNKSYLIRTINRKRFLILLVATIVINFFDFYKGNNEVTYVDRFPLQSALNMNMLVQGSWRLGGILYMFLVFVLAALPLSDVLVEDRKSGYTNQILLKISKKTYIKSLYVNNFIFGGLFALLPVFINLFLWMMVRPLFAMNYISGNLGGFEFLANLFVDCTPVFFILHFFFVFFVGGMIASLALITNDKLNNQYVGGLAVLAIDIFVSIICLIYSSVTHSKNSLTGLRELVINRSLPTNIISWVYLTVCLLIPIIYLKKKEKLEEIIWKFL